MTAKQIDDHKYTLEITAYDNPGVIVRIAQVFSRRGHSIETINVQRDDEHKKLPKLYVTAYGQQARIKQIVDQIEKLVDIHDIKFKEEN